MFVFDLFSLIVSLHRFWVPFFQGIIFTGDSSHRGCCLFCLTSSLAAPSGPPSVTATWPSALLDPFLPRICPNSLPSEGTLASNTLPKVETE